MTFAFSTKSLDWKTEYSFDPVGYATTKTDMISFKRVGSSPNPGVWVHDKTSTYNNFYGTSYPSKISVVSNNDPSATKIFEAFSLEGDKSNWSATFTTETGAIQRGSLASGSLVTREGKHYSDIPKNELNKEMTYTYVGRTTLGDLYNASQPGYMQNKIKIRGKVHAIPSELGMLLPNYSLEEFEKVVPVSVDDQAGYYNSYLALNPKGQVARYLPGFLTSTMVPYTNTSAQAELSGSIASSYKYDPYTNSIDYVSSDVFDTDDPAAPANAGNFFYTALRDYFGEGVVSTTLDGSRLALGQVPILLYSITPAEVNGEDMRGEFMRIDLTRSGTDYYELFAINVDQHKTKLDHSLGQNN